MISIRACALAAAVLVALGFGTAAEATPVMLEYTGVIAASAIAGVNVNDPITFKVFADNGTSGLASQSWSVSDIHSATLQAGSYSASAFGGLGGSAGGFTTDATGHLNALAFVVTQGGSDTNGATLFTYFMDATDPFWSDGSGGLSAASPPNTGNTTISQVAATPLPAAMPLLASALGCLGFLGWRRQRAYRVDLRIVG